MAEILVDFEDEEIEYLRENSPVTVQIGDVDCIMEMLTDEDGEEFIQMRMV